LVIIWLKRWPATPLTELPLLPPSVGGVGVGVGVGVGQGVAWASVEVEAGVSVDVDSALGKLEVGANVGEGDGDGDGVGVGVQPVTRSAADACCVCMTTGISKNAALSTAGRMMVRMSLAMVSARTAGRPIHRSVRRRQKW
jgi:hypothetical protein